MAIEKWERDISRFDAATGKIAEETKTFSLRHLVPEELDLLIISNSNTLKTYEQVKAYVNEQVALRRDKRSADRCRWTWTLLLIRSLQSPKAKETKEHRMAGHGLKKDALERHGRVKVLETATARRVERVACTWLTMSQKNAGKLADKLEEIMSFVSNLRGKGKDGKSKGKVKGGKRGVCWRCGKIGHVAAECWQKDAEMELYRASEGQRKGQKVPAKVNGKIRVRGLGVSPAGKEKATLGVHRKERTGLTRPIARRRMVIEHGHFRWRPEQLRTCKPLSPPVGCIPRFRD